MFIMLNETFPFALRPFLETVAAETLAVVQQRLTGPPPAGNGVIVCSYYDRGPDVLTFDGLYVVRLSVKDLYYSQFVYQLSHELGHVMLNPRRSNGLIETLTTAVSHQALDDLSARWYTQPPFEEWRNYAPEFRKYRQNEEASQTVQLPEKVRAAIRFGRWDQISLYLRFRRFD